MFKTKTSTQFHCKVAWKMFILFLFYFYPVFLSILFRLRGLLHNGKRHDEVNICPHVWTYSMPPLMNTILKSTKEPVWHLLKVTLGNLHPHSSGLYLLELYRPINQEILPGESTLTPEIAEVSAVLPFTTTWGQPSFLVVLMWLQRPGFRNHLFSKLIMRPGSSNC